MKLRKYLFIFCIFCSIKSYSQILNVEGFRLEKDTAHVFLGNAGVGFSTKKQPTNTLTRFNTNVNACFLAEKHSYMVLSTLAFTKVTNAQVQNEGYAHFRINFNRRKKISPEYFAQIQYDKGRGLDKRFLTGITMRSRIFLDKHWNISANTGFMWEEENWKLGTESANKDLIKSTSNLTIKAKLLPNVSWFFITYYQARVDDLSKARFITDTSLQLKISNRLAFNTQYIATFDTAPVIAIPKLIYSLNSTVQYNF